MYRDLATASVVPILTALVVGYFFLDPPWRWLILIPAIAIDALDIIVWLRWRKKRAMTGEDGMMGVKARVTSIEKPGRVTVKARGQLWKAEVVGNVHEGDEVVVTGVHGIRLSVEATDTAALQSEKPAS